MDRFAALIIALTLCFMPAAYAETTAVTNDEAALYNLPASILIDEFAAPKPGSDFDTLGDSGIVLDGIWYPIMRRFDDLKAALGEPRAIALTECDAHPDYYDKEFVYDFGSVFTHPIDGIDVWCELYISGSDLKTSRGIGIGSTLEDVTVAYGNECYVEAEYIYVYSRSGAEKDYASPSITFEIVKGAVASLTIHYPVFEQ